MLCRRLFGAAGLAAAAWALVFALVGWGVDAWEWSAFLHARAFASTAPYPSSFAIALCLFAFAGVLAEADARAAAEPSAGLLTLRLVGVVALVAAVVATHLATAVFATLGVAVFAFHRRAQLGRATWAWLAAPAVGVGIGLLWPLYPVASLFAAGEVEFHQHSRTLYRALATRAYPLLFALPVVVWRLRSDRFDPLAWLAASLAAVYAAGAALGIEGLGRAISYLGITLQIALAGAAVELERALRRGGAPGWMRAAAALALAAALFQTVQFARVVSLRSSAPESERLWEGVAELARFVEPDAVVAADHAVSMSVPAFVGKVVATTAPLYWTPDHALRRTEMGRFFRPTMRAERRRACDRSLSHCVRAVARRRAGARARAGAGPARSRDPSQRALCAVVDRPRGAPSTSLSVGQIA